MTCRELVELVTAYLEGVLSKAEQAAFEEHLALCKGCEDYVAQLRQTIALVGQLGEESLSEAARRRLLAAFSDWRSGH